MKTKFLLAIVVVQSLLLAASWFDSPRSARAEVPDPGRQRVEAVEELRAVNVKLDQLLAVLQEGKIEVRVITPDEKK